MLAVDAKVLVVHRRLFESDQSRFFVGRVQGYEAGIAKIAGRTFTRDQYGRIVRKNNERTKIVSLSSGTLIVYQLPDSVVLDALELRIDDSKRTHLIDGAGFDMDLTETPST